LQRAFAVIGNERHFVLKRHQPAVIDDADAVAQHLDFLEVVRRHEDRHTARVDDLEEIPQFEAQLDVHARRRLVQNEQLWPVHERSRERKPALHAAREFEITCPPLVGEFKLVKQFACAWFRLRERHAIVAALIRKNLFDRKKAIEIKLLRRQPDELAAASKITNDIMTENGNASALECRQPDNRIDGRRLAGAVGSKESKKLTGSNVERKIVDGGEGFVSFGKVPD